MFVRLTAKTRCGVRSIWTAAVACLVALALLATPSAAQGPATDPVLAHPLQHSQAADLKAHVEQLLGRFGMPIEVSIDAANNRLLVRGPERTQQFVHQLLETLDRPSAAAVEPVLKAYPRPLGELDATAAAWQAQWSTTPQVRIAVDQRTSQILVMAPPEVHAKLSGGAPPQSSPAGQLPSGGPSTMAFRTPPGDSSIVLRHTTWEQVAEALKRAYPGRIVFGGGSADQLTAQINLGSQSPLELHVNRRTNRIEVRGEPELAARGLRLLAALDIAEQRPEAARRVAPLPHGANDSVRRAADVFRSVAETRGGLPTPAPGGVPLMAQLFQPRPAGQDQGAAQGNAPPAAAPPAGAQPPAAAAAPAGNDALGTGLTGPVQIEFLDGLDVMIVSGHDRDVQRVLRIIEDIEKLSVETEPVIEVLPLQHVGSEAVAATVAQLYEQVLAPRQGRVNITALVKPNALLLIGRAESVKAVRELVTRLDQPVSPTAQFSVFALRHAAASDAQATIAEFFANRPSSAGKVQVTVDVRGNALIVQASPRELLEVAELLKRLDVSTSEAVNELRVFPLENSLADELASVLQESISGNAGVGSRPAAGPAPAAANPAAALAAAAQQATQGGSRTGKSMMLRFMTIDSRGQQQLKSGILNDVQITADPRANALLVSAPAESMELIAALIKQLDQIPAAESQIKVFTIVNGDAAALVQMLETLFGTRAAQGAGGGGGLLGGLGAQGAASFQGENPLIALRFSVDQRTNSIIASGSQGDLNVVEAILLRLDDSDVRQRQSTVYRLRNAPALDVANAINQLLRSQREVQQIAPGAVSPFEQIEREVIVVPERVSNSLIVSATPRYFEDIKKIVEQLDSRPPMVMIQVLIAEVKLDNTDEFGVEMGLQDSILFDRSLLGDLVTTTNSTQTPNGNTVVTTTNQIIQGASNTPGFAFNNQAIGNSGSDKALFGADRVGGQGVTNFAVGRVNNDLGYGGLVLAASSQNISLLIRALKASQRLDVLSRPQVMTLDNQPAFIQVGARVPRVQGLIQPTVAGQAPTLNVQDVNVGLILGVTPRISPDGLVVMEIDAERSSLGPESEGVALTTTVNGQAIRQPLINTTTAQTTVSALTGQTVILGGLITKSTAVNSRRVPGLSKIPILGHLFRYDSKVVERTELLIIMTPHVVRNEGDVEMLKHMESARMSWCLADVYKIHGDVGLRDRDGQWLDQETKVIYPDADPSGTRPLPPGSIVPETIQQPPGVVAPPATGKPAGESLPPPKSSPSTSSPPPKTLPPLVGPMPPGG